MLASRTCLVLGMLCLLLVSGCGGTVATGSLSGTVVGVRAGARGRTPITSGRVHFYHPELKKTLSAPIGSDGVYVVRDVPVGAVKVLVEGEPAVIVPAATGSKKAKAGFRVPSNYAALSTTPLQVDVKEGHQRYDVVVETPPGWARRSTR